MERGRGDDDVEDNVDNIENHFTVLYNWLLDTDYIMNVSNHSIMITCCDYLYEELFISQQEVYGVWYIHIS